MQQINDNSLLELKSLSSIKADFPIEATNYAEVLNSCAVRYENKDFYLVVGTCAESQGWILHISVVMSQVSALLKNILPYLIREGACFKVVSDKATARLLLDGHLGYHRVGKVLTIYPPNDACAFRQAKDLVYITDGFQGPAIPTDRHLGGCVYTRYGSFEKIRLHDANGNIVNGLKGEHGHLIPDEYPIPFRKPSFASWPFNALTFPTVSPPSKNLLHKYRPVSTLKLDARGNVFKAVYLKRGLLTGTCIIKEGKKYMCSDPEGRNIRDRLEWQKNIHEELSGRVPLPKIYDFFEEDGNSYLIMEFIKGVPLLQQKKAISGGVLGWGAHSEEAKKVLLEYALRIIESLQTLHDAGYVHRDVTPVNFMVDDRNNIRLIDIELAYSLKASYPTPPYAFGSPGYMSPEQIRMETPTIKEDIYGLSALMIELLVGLPAAFMEIEEDGNLLKNLSFFVEDDKICRLINRGLQNNPTSRPGLEQFRDDILSYKASLQKNDGSSYAKPKQSHNITNEITQLIGYCITGLASPPIVSLNHLWFAPTQFEHNAIETPQQQFSPYFGLANGAAGILYVLAQALKVGFSLEDVKSHLNHSIAQTLIHHQEIIPGLYNGRTGIARALIALVEAGLVKDDKDNQRIIFECLEPQNTDLTIAEGVAGRLMVVCQSRASLTKAQFDQFSQSCIQTLLSQQQRNGAWLVSARGDKMNCIARISFSFGQAGIIWSLLHYASLYSDHIVEKAAHRAMSWLCRKVRKFRSVKQKIGFWNNDTGIMEADWTPEILLTFIKYYEVFRDERSKKIVEEILNTIPPYTVHSSFGQEGGLACLGEIYLESARVFGGETWKNRAQWIAEVFLHTYKKAENGGYYWVMDEKSHPTAGLFMGNSGILHFLLRYLNPTVVPYRIIN
jgi:serine/threonine protein kinase